MNTIDKIKSMAESECIVDLVLKEATENECNDCGKCVFGYEGITQLQLILNDISEKKGKSSDLALINELCGLMKTQAICETGTEFAAAMLYAMEVKETELAAHITKKVCPAGVCKKFMTFHILPDKCTGCNECVEECEEEAILGKRRFIHVIDQDECIQCGACIDACDEEAIIRAGAVKPRCPKKPIPCKRNKV